jgi:hypothetical protein
MNNVSAQWTRGALAMFFTAVLALTVVAAMNYVGNVFHYLAFSIASHVLLWCGFRRNALFFDTVIGVLFWLGFWLKVSVRVAFFGGQFHDPTGNFDGSPAAFDQALTVCVVAFAGLLLASYLREKLFFSYPRSTSPLETAGAARFYERHRVLILGTFVATVVLVSATNFALGVYQRGLVPHTVLPSAIRALYTWLLLFGLASFCAVILHFELLGRRTISPAAAVATLLESFMTNTSMLSRGMVLNLGALGYGTLRALRAYEARITARFIVLSCIGFICLFIGSVLLVNAWRAAAEPAEWKSPQGARRAISDAKPLILDRWVGIEPVMAVSSYPHKGWALWSEAWNEKPAPQLSFYDRTMIRSAYENVDPARYNYVTLPGIVAFCFYPGSLTFLFVCMLIVAAIGAATEMAIFAISGRNLVLCALLAQVVASRWVHFGYAPSQTYLLFGALCLNLAVVHAANRFFARRDAAARAR